ncbi:MAG: hypothetical protein MK105_17405 [Crocinitomicaceae bacterium]|nr:hypothetical protein [Crocinitomicaceae bacterium]
MDRYLNRNEEQIQRLIETKQFSELSLDEKDVILSQMSEHEYKLAGLAIFESKSAYRELEAKPLILPTQKREARIAIPLWQAAASVAAAVLISFFVFRTEKIVEVQVGDGLMAKNDTIYMEKSIVDTVFKYETKYIDRIIESSSVSRINDAPVDNQLIKLRSNSFSTQELADLDPSKLQNKGQSVANDETFSLIDGLIMPD